MTQLTIDLNHIFTAATLQRGRDYFKKNKVSKVELDDEVENSLFGLVRGCGRKSYEVEVCFYDRPDDPEKDAIEGFCSCPVGYNCKHAVALLLSEEQRFGARRLNQMLNADDVGTLPSPSSFAEIEIIKKLLKEQFGNQLTNDALEAMVAEVLGEDAPQKNLETPMQIAQQQARKLEEQRNNWLRRLEIAVKNREREEAEQGSNTNITLYILEESPYQGGVIVQICLSRYLKKAVMANPAPVAVPTTAFTMATGPPV